MEIRALTAADVDIYWPLRLRALREEPDAFGSTYEEAKERPLASVIEQLDGLSAGGNRLLGAFDEDGQLMGIVAFKRESGHKNRHIGVVFQVYVAPEERGKGYARALMDALIAHVRALDGLEQLVLDVVINNTAARELYRSLGFETYGLKRKALKQDEEHYLDEELMVLWL